VVEAIAIAIRAIAPSYLNIAGRWQDHVLPHLLNDDVDKGCD